MILIFHFNGKTISFSKILPMCTNTIFVSKRDMWFVIQSTKIALHNEFSLSSAESNDLQKVKQHRS